MDRHVDLAILTVLPEEYQAVYRRLLNPRPAQTSIDVANQYAWVIGEISHSATKNSYSIVLGMTGQAGTSHGALATMDAIDRWHPRYVLFVGIAGGFEAQDVNKGDVVIADLIYGYEYGKLEPEFIARDDWTYQVDPALLNCTIAFAETNKDWVAGIYIEPPERGIIPKVIRGHIASGDKVVDDPTGTFFSCFSDPQKRIVAVEMEGVGAAQAIRQAQSSGAVVGFLMVRGISDTPRATDVIVGRGSRERDAWKGYAADVVAAFAVSYIASNLPIPPSVMGGQGIPSKISGVTSHASTIILTSQIDYFAEQISGEVGFRLDEMRSALREGKRAKASDWIKGVKADKTSWLILSADVKAKLLRFDASLELDDPEGISKAKSLADEAQELFPSEGDARLRAMIAYKETGPESALRFLVGDGEPDSLNLKAALHLEIGQISEARDLLWSEQLEGSLNAETHRLRALWYLSVKETDRSLLEIHKALELEPSWEGIQYAAAIIYYSSAISPAALPDRLVPFPEPVISPLVKKDCESLSRVRKAAQILHELIDSLEADATSQQRLRSWLLACLAIDPDQQDEAIEFCGSILNSNPTNFTAIVWAVTRNMGVDLEPSIKGLEIRFNSGDATVPHIIALVSCYLAYNLFDEAVDLLEHARPVFEQHQAEEFWIFWRVQSLAISGKHREALELLDANDLEYDLRDARSTLLRSLALKDDDWQPLIDHLEDSFTETRNPAYLLECCGLKAQLQQWDYIAERAKQLIDELGTSDALYLAVISTYNAKCLELCLGLLNDYQHLYMNGRLPGTLRRIQILARENLGLLPEALSDAETLANEEPKEENLLALAQIYYRVGDLKKLSVVARRLNSIETLDPENALGIARLIQSEDQKLARSLWRKAVSKELSDDLVGEALALGFQLGLDDEIQTLHSRIHELGLTGRGGIEFWSVEKLIELGTQFQEQRAKLNEAYTNAAIPIHFFSEQTNRPLVDYYHRILKENERVLVKSKPYVLLGRHGGRAGPFEFRDNKPDWRLNLDVTALLMAAHFELLSSVEEQFSPLRIPSDMMPTLVQMREQLSPHQPARVQIYRELINLEAQGKLHTIDPKLPQNYENTNLIDEMDGTWVSLLEYAHSNDGYLVDFLPLLRRDRSGPPTSLLEDTKRLVVNSRSIIESLRLDGPFTEQEYLEALDRLGIEGGAAISTTIPSQGSNLYFHANTSEVLAGAKILSLVCDRFRVHIEVEEFKMANAAIGMYESEYDVVIWIDGLMERVRNGIEVGIYQLIPAAADITENSTNQPRSLATRCLLDLLRFEGTKGDVIWSDDRYLNSYLRRDSVPIISILEVLNALVSTGALDLNAYYGKLQRLREANVLFIPFEKDEILHHLQLASIVDGRIIETQALSSIRRYACASLLSGDILQHPPLPESSPNKYGEVAYVMSLGRAITNALVESWAASNVAEASCRARAEWILSNIYLDHLALLRVTSMLTEEQDHRYLVSLSLAGLLAQAIILESRNKSDSSSPRKRYLDWIFNRFIRRRIEADQPLLLNVVALLKQLLISEIDTDLGEVETPVVLAVIQALYHDLPKEIGEQLSNDVEFMESIGLRYQPMVAVGDLTFDPDKFFQEAAKAINGRQGTIVPTGIDTEVIIKQGDEAKPDYSFFLDHPVSGERFLFEDPLFRLLSESVSERERFLRGNRHWFEVANEVFDRELSRISTIEDPGMRIEEARKWKASSVQVFYDDLRRHFLQRQEFTFDGLMPPSSQGLLWAFRLESELDEEHEFHEILNIAARALRDDEGLSRAILRFSYLPTPLPGCLIDSALELSKPEKRLLTKQLIQVVGTSLTKFHLLHILLLFGDEELIYRRFARRILISLITDAEKVSFEAYKAIFNWTNNEFDHWPEVKFWPTQIRLSIVWAHAAELYRIFNSSGVPDSWLENTFNLPSGRFPTSLFDRDPKYWLDIALPRRVDYETFFVAGLIYSFSETNGASADKQAQDILLKLAFQDIKGKLFPNLPLLRDPSRNLNCLQSFLAADLGNSLKTLFSINEGDLITQKSLHKHAKASLDQLSKVEDDISAWLQLYTIVGDTPIYEDMHNNFRALLCKTDYSKLIEKDVKTGLIPMIFASHHSINYKDEDLTQHLRDQLVRIAKHLSGRETVNNMSRVASERDRNSNIVDIGYLILESAINISLSTKSDQAALSYFGELLRNLVSVLPSMKDECNFILQRIYEDLPVEESMELLPSLVLLRAE